MSRQTIFTKWLGPTNHKGSRVKAYCDAGQVTVSWEYGSSVEENHKHAARTLAEKLGWYGEWHLGSAPQKEKASFVYVFAEEEK